MRKVIRCCLAVGAAAACCALGVAAYVWQNPDSPLGQWAATRRPVRRRPCGRRRRGPGDSARPGAGRGTVGPAGRARAARLRREAAAGRRGARSRRSSSTTRKTSTPRPVPAPRRNHSRRPPRWTWRPPPLRPMTLKESAIVSTAMRRSSRPPARPMMPRCADEAGPAPTMPRCIDDDSAPPMPPAGEDGPLGRGMHRPAAWSWWLGFFSGPSHLTARAHRPRPAPRRTASRRRPRPPTTPIPWSCSATNTICKCRGRPSRSPTRWKCGPATGSRTASIRGRSKQMMNDER